MVWQLETALPRSVARRRFRRADWHSAFGRIGQFGNRRDDRAQQAGSSRGRIIWLWRMRTWTSRLFMSRAATSFRGTEHRAVRIEATHFFDVLDTVTVYWSGCSPSRRQSASTCFVDERLERDVLGRGLAQTSSWRVQQRLVWRENSRKYRLVSVSEPARRLLERAGRVFGFSTWMLSPSGFESAG